MSIVGTEGNICLKICRKWKKDLLRASLRMHSMGYQFVPVSNAYFYFSVLNVNTHSTETHVSMIQNAFFLMSLQISSQHRHSITSILRVRTRYHF